MSGSGRGATRLLQRLCKTFSAQPTCTYAPDCNFRSNLGGDSFSSSLRNPATGLLPTGSIRGLAQCAEHDETHEHRGACWRCGATECRFRNVFSCPLCRALQPPSKGRAMNPFQIFEEKPSFDIDAAKLEGRFKALQKELHPDKFGNATADERHYAANYSSLVNASYNVLKDPLQRAQLLLQVSGVQGEDSDELTIDDPELLMEMMDMREAVDASDSEDDLRDLQKANDTQLKSCVSALSEAFSRGDVKAAVQGTQRLTYLYKVRDEIIKKL